MKTHDRVALLGPPIIVGLAACLLHVASSEVLALLTVWTLLSVPIGLLIGHGVLNED